MSDKVFLDTNLWVYFFVKEPPDNTPDSFFERDYKAFRAYSSGIELFFQS
jgi:predicted nucleic acid-binding protein